MIPVLLPRPARAERRVVKNMEAARVLVEFVRRIRCIVNHVSEGIDRPTPDRLETDAHTDIAEAIPIRPNIAFAIVQFDPVVAAPQYVVAIKIYGTIGNLRLL